MWTHNFPAEDSIFTATDNILEQWRLDTLVISDMLGYESQCADYALSKLQQAHHNLVPISKGDTGVKPVKFILKQNYPNPFNPNTVISWHLAVASPVKLTVYNSAGQKVAILVDERLSAGFHQTRFDGSNLANGLYLYRLETSNHIETRKMVLMK
jgi:hypothetical protein